MPQAALTGLIHSLLLGLGLAVFLGFSLYFTPLSQGLLSLLANIIIALAVFFGGLQAARIASTRGLVQGLAVGLLFFLVILAISWPGGTFTVGAIGRKLGICLLAGAMGGIAGLTGR